MKDACLSCSLKICDDRDARCAFVQIIHRTDYHADHYRRNKERKDAYAKEYQKANRERLNLYQRQRYHQKKLET